MFQKSILPAVQNRSFGGIKLFIGVLFFTVFSGFLMTYAGYHLTKDTVVKPMLAKILSITFKQPGNEEAVRVVNYLNELSKQKDAVQGLAQIDPNKIEADIQKMSPEESAAYLEKNIAGPLYENGTKIIEPLKAVDPNAEINAERLDFISMLNTNSNDIFKNALKYEEIAIAVLLLLLILLSQGFGRISAPGKAILLASLPGLLIFSLFKTQILERFAEPLLGQYASGPIYLEIKSEVIDPIIVLLRNIHLVPAVVGLALMALAFVLHLLFKPKQAEPTSQNTSPAPSTAEQKKI